MNYKCWLYRIYSKRLESPRLRSLVTMRGYLSTANIFMEWLPHDTPIMESDFRDFFTYQRKKGISERTLRTQYFQIKKLAEANHWPWPFIKEDTPVSKKAPFQPVHTVEEIEKIIAARDKFTKSERFFLAVATTWGCRREELSRIAKRDYNTETITLHIAKRNIDVEHLIPEVLKPIFEDYHPAHLTSSALSRAYHRVCEKAGLPKPTGWGWHSFRRMVMTALSAALVANGLQESWAATYMAWSQEETGQTFFNSQMAGVYSHGAESTTDRWSQEKAIIAAHPFIKCWLKPTVKADIVIQ